MKDKVLFIRDNPLLNSYPSQTYFFATFPTKEYHWWFYENSLNLHARKSVTNGYVDFFHPIIWKMDPWIISEKIGFDTVQHFSFPFSKLCRDALDSGKYILTYLDRYYLRNAPEYHTNHYWHEVMIYGYTEECLYIADFRGPFVCGLEFASDIDKAFAALITDKLSFLSGNVTGVILFYYREPMRYTLNYSRVAQGLYEYMEGKTSFLPVGNGIHYKYTVHPEDFIFGIQVYQFLQQYIERQVKKSVSLEEWDLRGVHLIYQHKVMIQQLLLDICINDDKTRTVFDSWKQVCDYSRMLELTLIKGVVTQRDWKVMGIVDMLDVLCKKELMILPRIVQLLEDDAYHIPGMEWKQNDCKLFVEECVTAFGLTEETTNGK